MLSYTFCTSDDCFGRLCLRQCIFLMQFQADILGADVLRPECIETTALGAAYLAGLATGYWQSREEIEKNWQLSHRFVPSMSDAIRQERLKGWDKAVRCALMWQD